MKSEDAISYAVRGAAFNIYNELGPGLFESVYEACLIYLLKKEGFFVQSQVGLPVIFQGVKLDMGFRIDILIDNLVVLEVKSVAALHDVHPKQLLTYLKLSKRKLGLLINFNESPLKIIRIANGL
ncbi:MAG: GxxExxY protein [Bacteroidota bacterium]